MIRFGRGSRTNLAVVPDQNIGFFPSAIHHQTFRLSDEPMNEPIDRLQLALDREPERLALRRVGQTFVCPVT
jgi:hypothetical protein